MSRRFVKVKNRMVVAGIILIFVNCNTLDVFVNNYLR